MTFSSNVKENKQRGVKDTWGSEFAYGWSRSGVGVSNGVRGVRCRPRGPESTMSVGSDIRFTRRKLSRTCRGCCAAIAAMLVLLLLAAVAVYLAHMYLFGDPLNRQTFRGSFVMSSWGSRRGDSNGTREEELRNSLQELYKQSELRSCFIGGDILALDTTDEGIRVHFEVSFEPIFTSVSTWEVNDVIVRDLKAPVFFQNVFALPDTLHIEESSMISSQTADEPEATALDPPTTEAVTLEVVEDVRECSPINLGLCTQLPYNETSYPNLVGHSNRDSLMRDLVAFRELLDAECSHLAQDFVCQLLQPQCSLGHLVKPCRSYCRAFHAGCGARLPERLRTYLDCSRFPEYHGPGSCNNLPGCSDALDRQALSGRACDGVPDCANAEDERDCSHCSRHPTALRCGLQTTCIPAQLRCDGTPDCPDGSDEAGCLWISRSLMWWVRENSESTLGAVRSRAGYALWAERGRAGKICAHPYTNDTKALSSLGTSLCRALTYKTAISTEAVPDLESETNDIIQHNALSANPAEYVEVMDPFAPEIAFVKSNCPEKKVIKVVCDQLECGTPSARTTSGVTELPRSARPGDWPWLVALFRSHVHACDAVLVHHSWLLTAASCFQGQPKAEWIARLGSVRIQSTTPWQQERRIVGMVRSPVEGSMLALVRLEDPVEITDFVRPVCLPEASTDQDDNVICNTLGWTRNRDQLQRIHVVTSPMNTCENASIATVNGICAEPLYDQDDCDEEEYAGSSMMCYSDKTQKWYLQGVSGWRIACTKIGLGRPRIYDAVTSHVDWIKRSISNSAR